MDHLSQIVTGLRLTRPSIDYAQLLALESPRAEFEAHVPAEKGKDFWIYTVDGKMVDGEAIVVRAALPIQAETLAQEGLRDTIAALRKHDANTGLQAQVEMRPAHEAAKH
jgi:hypothetical protein